MLSNIFGSYTDINKKLFKGMVQKTNPYYQKYKTLTDSKEKVKVKIDGKYVAMTREDLAFLRETNKFRKRLNNGEALSSISLEALALCKEAIYRKYDGGNKIELYDVQLEAAIAMQDNNIVEMKTGEGKSLVQIASAYLNALVATKDPDKSKWKSVHVFTSNDYLAQRDQGDNKAVFSLLGLTSSYILPNSEAKSEDKKAEKRRAYTCDIIYAAPKTVAFDYLADNTVYDKKKKYITKAPSRAIIDEADDILLDTATTPLILSGASAGFTTDNPYVWATNYINGRNIWKRPIETTIFNQYEQDSHKPWKFSTIYLDTGDVEISDEVLKDIEKATLAEGKSEVEWQTRADALRKCLLAKYVYKRDTQYIVENNKVVLIDAGTGRVMPGTKLRDGMQEAIEYKEEYLLQERQRKTGGKAHIQISKTNYINAKCTYPDFLKIYENGVCGMTGTADRDEFKDIYGLDTYVVDTHKKNQRMDEEDELYLTKADKYKAIVREVIMCQRRGGPVLLGTLDIKESEELYRYLIKAGISKENLQILNAVNKDNEDQIIKKAGEKGMVTVATNMAGRGSNIKLKKEVIELGGLYVIGTSKNKNARIDNQLRGRAARQGQPGRCKYFMALDDEMVVKHMPKIDKAAIKRDANGRVLDRSIVNLVNKAQSTEASFAKMARKVSEERDAKVFTPYKNKIYEQRNTILNASDGELLKYISDIIDSYIRKTVGDAPEYNEINAKFGHITNIDANMCSDSKTCMNKLSSAIRGKIKKTVTRDNMKEYISIVRKNMLKCIDEYWVSYIEQVETLNKSAYLLQFGAGYNVDTYEYQAAVLYDNMIRNLQNELITYAVFPTLPYGKYMVKSPEVESEIIL